MHRFWSGVARVFAILFSILFVPTMAASILLTGLERRAFNAATYKNALDQQQVYTRLPRVIAEQLVMSMNANPCADNPLTCENASPQFLDCARTALGDSRFTELKSGGVQPDQSDLGRIQRCVEQFGAGAQSGNGESSSGGAPTFFRNLSLDTWVSIISQVAPPQTLRTTTEDLLDQLFAYLNGRQDTVALHLAPLKSRLSGQVGKDIALQIIRSQPACSLEQLAQLAASLISGGGGTLFCRPPDEVLRQMAPVIQQFVGTISGQIPDQITLLPVPGQGASGTRPDPVAGIRLARLLMRLSPDLPLGLLLLITLLVIRTPKAWLRWWGIPLVFAGLLALIIVPFITGAFEWGWVNYLSGRVPTTVAIGTVALLHDLARAILQGLQGGVVVGGAVLMLCGLCMWIGSAFIKNKPAAGVDSQGIAA